MSKRDAQGLTYEDRLLKNAIIELERGNREKAEQFAQEYFLEHDSFKTLEITLDGWEILARRIEKEPDEENLDGNESAENKPKMVYHVEFYKMVKTESFDFPI